MSDLPWPTTTHDIADVLSKVDPHILSGSERFVRQQLAKSTDSMLSGTVSVFPLGDPTSYWLNVISLFHANQQINEACNKAWGAAELANVTSRSMWQTKYEPIGAKFGRLFAFGTIIPTLYYAEISAIISILSSFGCVPVLVRGRTYFLVRTSNGWRLFARPAYIKSNFGVNPHGWHNQIVTTYFGLISQDIMLPKISRSKVVRLKNLRNEMHYSVLGDLKMWRAPKLQDKFANFFPLVDKTVMAAISVLQTIKTIANGCDERYYALREVLSNRLRLL